MVFMGSPLDLNNLPEDLARDHDIQPLHLSSPAAAAPAGSYRKKKSGGKDESRMNKVYDCRFCTLKFCKSQALGGHMNRHRQERETETLNRARKLVFGSDDLYQSGNQPTVHGGYHHQEGFNNMGSNLYPTRLFSKSSTTVLQPPPSPPPYPMSQSIKDYFAGHVCSGNPQYIVHNLGCIGKPPDGSNSYTCIGAPVGQAFIGKDISISPINRYDKDGCNL